MPERLRTLRHCIFTGGVVMVNGICSAAFSESAALWGYPLPFWRWQESFLLRLIL